MKEQQEEMMEYRAMSERRRGSISESLWRTLSVDDESGRGSLILVRTSSLEETTEPKKELSMSCIRKLRQADQGLSGKSRSKNLYLSVVSFFLRGK